MNQPIDNDGRIYKLLKKFEEILRESESLNTIKQSVTHVKKSPYEELLRDESRIWQISENWYPSVVKKQLGKLITYNQK